MKQLKQAGFTVIEAIIVVVIVGALLGVGVWVVKNQSDNKEEKDTNTSQTTEDESVNAPDSPSVDKASDLDSAEKALDDSNLDAGTSDNTEIDGQVNAF